MTDKSLYVSRDAVFDLLFWLDNKKTITDKLFKLPTIEDREIRRWIPITERVPDDDRLVIVCDDKGSVWTDYYFNDIEDYWQKNHIIAWQDLPEPYKKESELKQDEN